MYNGKDNVSGTGVGLSRYKNYRARRLMSVSENGEMIGLIKLVLNRSRPNSIHSKYEKYPAHARKTISISNIRENV